MKQRVAVAMSGGIDSTVVAALLREQGWDVIGVTARLWRPGGADDGEAYLAQAAQSAAQLGIPHHVIDLRDAFRREIVERMAEAYAHGRTPSPCGWCNPLIKFGRLMDAVAGLGVNRLASGHYARAVERGDARFRLLKGVDSLKDQSYFLFALSQTQLRRALFPLGSRTKDEVRSIAAAKRLHVADRSESQELCFAADRDHFAVTEMFQPQARRKGPVVDLDGRVLGTHEGIHRFTIGQRRGVGVASGSPVYVVGLRAADNAVVVGPRSALMASSACVEKPVWIMGEPPAGVFSATTRIRYNHGGAASRVEMLPSGAAQVQFAEPQFAVTPGQIAVFYDGDEVLGGGWIGAPG